MIKIENISKSYVRGKNIIDNLNLEIKMEKFWILGPNGAGENNNNKDDNRYFKS